ncbi:methyl-accepting chemotaxis protein [Halomicrobium sp. LC1Hm]|uniref:methyl-accepting chemotaxis protein n=1 Tax=Halomicrobium sp. LC1Hm TaxID=2610902 RepID=UPI001885DD85|nr:methyl-accepting chemotaxis protein [Halomicrobium sp. LC1Hm]
MAESTRRIIEAAHANGGGDADDGFAVVAEETSAQTEEIEGIIRGVQASTGELAADMREARERMLDGASSVEETKEIFEDVVDHVEGANDGIHAINEATDQQATVTSEIVAMVDDVSEIGTETAEETGEPAAAAEEQTASITSVTEQIMTLSEKAERLETLTADFEVTENSDTSP